MKLDQKINPRALLAVLATILVCGFAYPYVVSWPHVKSERGAFEKALLYDIMDDWRIVRPCLPSEYLNPLKVAAPACPAGEEQAVVESICWFGVHGPKMRICYQEQGGASLGTGKPIVLP
ncbi:MAG: hypothetical protein WC866_02245 [Patescibacteria group bacterium]|jgi:hypothetical protein